MRTLLAALALAGSAAPQAHPPLRLHPANPHYYEFRGRPLVVITSAEHYGAVLNLDFDYTKYLDTLREDGMNLTRIFTGLYREFPSDFGIVRNTLAPAERRLITPFDAPPRASGSSWNAAYFTRLKDFVRKASERGIIAEVTLFTAYYDERRWRASVIYREGVPFTEALTLKHRDLVEIQTGFVRKIVSELREFDNVLYEICNEPYFSGVALDWQRQIARTIRETDPTHLIAQNIANNTAKIADPDPNVSVFHFHYARPPDAIAENYSLNRLIGYDETGFDGALDAPYRLQAWDFVIAGGGHFNHLDYSFTVGHEDGTFLVPAAQPGSGSKALRAWLATLSRFIHGFDFVRMKPAQEVIVGGVPEGASARVLAEPGRQYAIYLHHGKVLKDHKPRYVIETSEHRAKLELRLPAGAYRARWLNPKNGKIENAPEFTHSGGLVTLATPAYREDIALELRSAGR